MEWTSIYKTGNEFIDDQHKTLFDQIHKIKRLSVDTPSLKDDLSEILNFLEEYVVTHFSDEEKYMDSISYPFLEQHKTIHLNFVNDFLKLKYKALQSEDFKPSELFIFLIKWLQQHIAIEDQKYVKYQKSLK